MQCRKYPHWEKGPLLPLQANSLPIHPVWVCLRGMCSWDKKATSERRNQQLWSAKAPLNISNRKALVLSLKGSQDQKNSKRKSAWTPHIPDLINIRLLLPNKGNHCQPGTGGCSHLLSEWSHPARESLQEPTDAHNLRAPEEKAVHTLTTAILICRMNERSC